MIERYGGMGTRLMEQNGGISVHTGKNAISFFATLNITASLTHAIRQCEVWNKGGGFPLKSISLESLG